MDVLQRERQTAAQKFGKSGWNSRKCQKYYKLFDSLAVDAYVTRKETQPDVASEQQWDFPNIWWNSDHLQPIQLSHFQSRQTRKNRITELEDISLCLLHIENCMGMTVTPAWQSQDQIPHSVER